MGLPLDQYLCVQGVNLKGKGRGKSRRCCNCKIEGGGGGITTVAFWTVPQKITGISVGRNWVPYPSSPCSLFLRLLFFVKSTF